MAIKKLKHYSVTLDSDVFAVSLVDEPAIESNFITLSKIQEKRIALEQEDKHIVMGAVLIPDMPIYRNQDGEEFYIQFNRDTIETLAHNFLKEGRNYNFSYQHAMDVEGVSVIESWIVNDPEKDKSATYGIDVPSGTWMMAAKVDNEDLWSKIKSGEAKGFSIEAIVNLDEIKLNKDNNMAEEKKVEMETVEITESFWDKLKQIISDALGVQKEDPAVADAVAQVEEEVKQPEGETKPVEQSEDTPEEALENPKADAIAEEVINEVVEDATTPEEAQANLQDVIDSLNAQIETLKAEIEQLKSQNTELNSQVEKLNKQPSTKPVKVGMGEQKQSPREIIEALRNGTYFK